MLDQESQFVEPDFNKWRSEEVSTEAAEPYPPETSTFDKENQPPVIYEGASTRDLHTTQLVQQSESLDPRPQFPEKSSFLPELAVTASELPNTQLQATADDESESATSLAAEENPWTREYSQRPSQSHCFQYTEPKSSEKPSLSTPLQKTPPQSEHVAEEHVSTTKSDTEPYELSSPDISFSRQPNAELPGPWTLAKQEPQIWEDSHREVPDVPNKDISPSKSGFSWQETQPHTIPTNTFQAEEFPQPQIQSKHNQWHPDPDAFTEADYSSSREEPSTEEHKPEVPLWEENPLSYKADTARDWPLRDTSSHVPSWEETPFSSKAETANDWPLRESSPSVYNDEGSAELPVDHEGPHFSAQDEEPPMASRDQDDKDTAPTWPEIPPPQYSPLPLDLLHTKQEAPDEPDLTLKPKESAPEPVFQTEEQSLARPNTLARQDESVAEPASLPEGGAWDERRLSDEPAVDSIPVSETGIPDERMLSDEPESDSIPVSKRVILGPQMRQNLWMNLRVTRYLCLKEWFWN
ncbi:hypothetical protein CDD82_3699 [Ophiocordyceps australis]|uniref:Uncharacterized protein n=1 Tax=Ophiocordyceps australis TaxID=1399860 RepID=A0A2C5ZAV1_9HYPO|nr:hypothetical protein CDD82_3699 [Ophiocordyceps australis]